MRGASLDSRPDKLREQMEELLALAAIVHRRAYVQFHRSLKKRKSRGNILFKCANCEIRLQTEFHVNLAAAFDGNDARFSDRSRGRARRLCA